MNSTQTSFYVPVVALWLVQAVGCGAPAESQLDRNVEGTSDSASQLVDIRPDGGGTVEAGGLLGEAGSTPRTFDSGSIVVDAGDAALSETSSVGDVDTGNVGTDALEDAGDVHWTLDTLGGDGGSPSISLTECGQKIHSRALEGSPFATCMGFPTIASNKGDVLKPVTAICSVEPKLITPSVVGVSLQNWFYRKEPLTDFWVGPVMWTGIQSVVTLNDGNVLVAGMGELSGDFYNKPHRLVLGVVSPAGILASAQTGPLSPMQRMTLGPVHLSDGSYGVVVDGDDQQLIARLQVSSNITLSTESTAYSGYSFRDIAATSGGGIVAVADQGVYEPNCSLYSVVRLGDGLSEELKFGGEGYKVRKDLRIVPLGNCGYGLVLPAKVFNDEFDPLPVVVRLDEEYHVAGLWRWNIPSGGFGAGNHGPPFTFSVDGDLLLGTGNFVMRVDGTTGDIKWYTDLNSISENKVVTGIVTGMTPLPSGRVVVAFHAGGTESEGYGYASLGVLGTTGCVEATYSFKDNQSAWAKGLNRLSHLAAVSETQLVGVGTRHEVPARSEIFFVEIGGSEL